MKQQIWGSGSPTPAADAACEKLRTRYISSLLNQNGFPADKDFVIEVIAKAGNDADDATILQEAKDLSAQGMTRNKNTSPPMQRTGETD